MKITDEMVARGWDAMARLSTHPPSYDAFVAGLRAAFAVSPAADMLAALNAMVAWFDDDDSFCLSDEDSCDNCVERRKEWRIACAAIAKAEGRTEATDG